jgi:hypothetical protein
MKYDNNKVLFLEYADLIAAGVQEGTIKSARATGTWGGVFVKDQDDSRKLLVQYEGLKDKYKQLIIARFGDPYKYMSAYIIEQMLIPSDADKHFITHYKLPDDSFLPVPAQTEYIAALSYLHLLATISVAEIRALGFSDCTVFTESVLGLIKGNDIKLPRSYTKLRAKVREYKKAGAKCIISKKWCNNNAIKVKDEICEAVLLGMIEHESQFEDSIVALNYNKWAKENNYKPITDRTVGIWRNKKSLLVVASREGTKAWQNQYSPVIKRIRPTAPLLLINSDDNNLDLFFREDGKNYVRVTGVFVMDAFNDYILGYAIGRSQTAELVHQAFLNAVHHVRELTGEQLYWHQVQTDSWGLKALRDWYELQAKFTPTKTGNSRGKVIEQAFGHNWHRFLKLYNNYSGHNITAKKKANWEMLDKNKKDFPTIEEAPAQIAHFVNNLRTHVNEKTGKSKQEQWLEAFGKMLPEQKRELTDTKRLLYYGMPHQYTNKLTNAGLNITIGRKMLGYDVPKEDYLKHVGKTVQVLYDPYDPLSVLATMDDCRVQVLCPVYEKMKMALADMVDGDRAKLNIKLQEQKEVNQYVLNEKAKRMEQLQQRGINTAEMLNAPWMNKEDRQLEENAYYQRQLDNGAAAEEEAPEEQSYFQKLLRQGGAK